MRSHFGRQYPKCRRLRKRMEFLQVQRRGHKVYSPAFVGIFIKRPEGCSRIGITVTKRVGNAVVRNRIKRLTREAFRLGYMVIPENVDFVVIAKKSAREMKSGEIFGNLSRLGRNARQLMERMS